MTKIIALLLLLTSVALASPPKHLVARSSYGEIVEHPKHPCTGDFKKTVIDEVRMHVAGRPRYTLTADEILLKIGDKDVAADSYALESDGSRLLDPITGHWRLDASTDLSISIRREVHNIQDSGRWIKMLTTMISIVKYRGTRNECFEQWEGQSQWLREDEAIE